MWIDLSDCAEHMKILVSQVNGHLAEKDFNNKVDRMTSSVDISQFAFQATFVITH